MPRSTSSPSALERCRRVVAVGGAAAVGFNLVGYPLLQAARARLAPKPVLADPDARPSITILVPAHDEADVIADKLTAMGQLRADDLDLEVVVVDDGSTDGTGAIVERFVDDDIRLVGHHPRRGKPAAIDAGVQAARGEVIVLTDASALFDRDALLAAIAPFADPSVGVVSGQNLMRGGGGAVEQPAGLYWRYQERLRRWESATGSTVGVTGNLFVFRRADHRPLPADTINDEFAIAMDIAGRGGRVLYVPDAIAYDQASASMSEEMARRSRITAGRYQSLGRQCRTVAHEPGLLGRVVAHKVLRAVSPLLLLATAVASLVGLRRAAGRGGPLRTFERFVLVPGQLGVYGAAALGAVLERRGHRLPKLVSVPYYLVAGYVAGLQGLARAVRGGQSVLWDKRAAASAGPDAIGADRGSVDTAGAPGGSVVLVDLARRFGGTEARVLHLATELAARDVPVRVVCLDGGVLAPKLQAAGIATDTVSVRRADPRVLLTLVGLLRRHRPAAIDAHGVHSQFWSTLASLCVRGPRLVLTVHSEYGAEQAGRRRGGWYDRVLASARACGATYIAVSEPVRDHVVHLGVPADRVRTVRNAVPPAPADALGDRQATRRELGIPEDALVLTTVARLHPVKGHATMLEALQRVDAPAPVHWLVVGDGDELASLSAGVGAAGLGDRVHLLGFRDDVPALLHASDLLVLPSLSEGLPLVVPEAMLQEVPVVASEVGGLPTTFDDHECCFVPAGDADALAAALTRLLGDATSRAALGRAGAAATRARLSPETMLDETLRTYGHTVG
jgi:glycosyltransferase involved in cell wall biosynthesis